MALLKIARMGHPVLVRRADPVGDPAAPSIRALARDMVETMADAGGVGLAAPQVHVPLRLIAWRSAAGGVGVLADPVVEALGDATEEGWEGCLSVPGLRGVVPRASRVRYAGRDLEGRPVEGVAEGFEARVLQHEVDHLDGVLYLSRMTDLSRLGFQEELARAERAARAPAAAGDAPGGAGDGAGDGHDRAE